MSRLTLRHAILALGLLAPLAAHADPFVQTFVLRAPSEMSPQDSSTGSYNLVIDYVLTQDDLLDARIDIDLPDSIIVVDVGDNAPFTTYCDFDPTQPYHYAYDWKCTLSASRLDVGTGLSGQLVLRIVPAHYQFTNGQQVQLRATISGSNLATPVTASVTSNIMTTLALLDYPSVGEGLTVESPFIDGDGLPRVGLGTRLYRQCYNSGNGYIAPGAECRTAVAPGQEAYYLESDYSTVWPALNEMWEPIGTATTKTPYPFGYGGIQVQGNGASGYRAWSYRGSYQSGVLAWNPCSDRIKPNDLTAEIWGSTDPQNPNALQKLDMGQTTTFGLNADFDCSSDATVQVYGDAAVPGAQFYVQSYFEVPMGAVPLRDFFATLAVDPRLSYNYLSSFATPTRSGAIDIEIYGCHYTAGQQLTSDVFLATKDSACAPLGTQYANNGEPLVGFTHFVAYTDSYYLDESYGRAVPRGFYFQTGGILPCDLSFAPQYGARLSARRTSEGPLVTTEWRTFEPQLQDQIYFPAYGPYFIDNDINFQQIISANRGQTFALYLDHGGAQLGENPSGHYTIPPGIVLLDAQWRNGDSTCDAPDAQIDIEETLDGTNLSIDLRAADGSDEWFYMQNCAQTDCSPAGSGYLMLSLYVDPTHPWRDGDQAHFETTWDSENNGDYGPVVNARDLTINVPSQQRLFIEPVCEGEGNPEDCGNPNAEPRRPGLKVTLANRGGIDLTDMLAEVPLPREGDAAGSEHDAFFHSIVADPGLSIECFNGVSWSALCNATTTRIRARAASIGPATSKSYTVILDIPPDAATGDKLYGTGQLQSNELPSVPASSVSPIRVNLCPGTLSALVFFDENQNGELDEGERGLPDWFLSLEDNRGESSEFELGFGGDLQVLIAEGVYAWDVRPATPSAESEFVIVGGLDQTFEICAEEFEQLVVPVTCTCDDGIACTIDRCNFLGQCIYERIPGPIEGVLDDTCDAIDQDCDDQYDEDYVPTDTKCQIGGCTGTGQMLCDSGELYDTCEVTPPTEEKCNGIDDDCDGLTDRQDDTLEFQLCEQQKGVCMWSYKSADKCINYTIEGQTFGYWAACQTGDYLENAYLNYTDAQGNPGRYSEPQRGADACDGLDNDCDGSTDENFQSEMTFCGVGQCASLGSTYCDSGFVADSCTPNREGDFTEVCDGLDNDCNTLSDAGDPNLMRVSCENQEGACQGALKPIELCAYQGDGFYGWSPCGPAAYAANAPGVYGVSEALCDGIDNDCDGETDEDFVGAAFTCGLGSCTRDGFESCVEGRVVRSCEPGAAGLVEVCNAEDDDCDGLTDAFDPDLQRQLCSNQQGVCAGALFPASQCINGVWAGACPTSAYAANAPGLYSNVDATCDGIDNDCSAGPDDDYPRQPITCGLGTCQRDGERGCSNGKVVDTCETITSEANEICNGLDDDCDGLTDTADPDLIVPHCEDDDGVCAGLAKPLALCLGIQGWSPCSAQTYASLAYPRFHEDDDCDGEDNDCDGQADEGFVTAPVICEGGCASVGSLVCLDGELTDTCVAGEASPEVCDGIDNDCDDLVDAADPDLVRPLCENQDGVCEGATKRLELCTPEGWLACSDADYAAHGFPFYSVSDTTCDGRDNDCDEATDEDFVGATTVCGIGACSATGRETCVDGELSAGCTPRPEGVEICDGRDNDCDGHPDDGLDCSADTTVECPASPSAATSFTFAFANTDGEGTTFECRFDGGPWIACDGGSFAVSELAAGSHTFVVRATSDGIVDDTPAFCAWLVDPSVPDTLILVGPADPDQVDDAQFAFGSNGPVETYMCALDGGEYVPCEQLETFEDLAPGPHDLSVYAINTLGIADPSPATWEWTIDTSMPATSIVSGPPSVVRVGQASFTFASADTSVESFRCRLDAADWSSCAGTVTFETLVDGQHVFEVAAIDGSGNIDPTPARVVFTVDTSPPTTLVVTRPADPSQSGTAIFGLASDTAGATFRCKLDDAAYADCGATVTYSGLADGLHTFSAYALGAVCGEDASAEVVTWTIDTSFPETDWVQTPPVATSKDATNEFSYEDPTDDEVDDFECQLDGGAWVACDGGTFTAGVLPEGTHELHVRSCTLRGEERVCDPTPAVYGWSVTDSACPLDREAPVMTCVESIDAVCVDGGATVELPEATATATDACGDVAITHDDQSYPLGVTPVVFTGHDGNGNVGTCITSVVVRDTAKPTITCPANVSVSTGAEACGATAALGTPTVDDTCFGEAVSVFDDARESYPVGDTTVTFTALDGAGNFETCSLVVTVTDDSPMTLTCDATSRQVAPADACAWTGELQAQVVDNCVSDIALAHRSETWPVGTSDVTFAVEQGDDDASCTTRLTVVDETAPVIACGVVPDARPAIVTSTADDACGATVTLSDLACSGNEGDCPAVLNDGAIALLPSDHYGTITVSWKAHAVDASGNSADKDCQIDLVGKKDDRTPLSDLSAEGSGGCAGAGEAWWLAALGLVGMRMRKRASAGVR